MTKPKVPDPYWAALRHRRDEAWTTVLDAEADLPALRERDRDRQQRTAEQRETATSRFPTLED